MAFLKMTKGTLGLVAGVALAAFATVNGVQEAAKDNQPGETNTEQFFRGFVRAPIDAVKGAVKGVSEAFDSDDVKGALENAEEAGRRVIEGTGGYIDSRSDTAGTRRRNAGPVEPLPDYVPGNASGEPPKDAPEPNR